MKNISTLLSVVALVLIGVLFYLHFSSKQAVTGKMVKADTSANKHVSIAYFDIESLQEHYDYYNDALAQMKKREASINAELQSLKNSFQRRVQELQQKGPAMSQAEGEAAQRELATMEQNYRRKESELQESLQNQQMEFTKDMRKEIEKYLTEYNKQKGYTYIFSYEPGFIMYYKDTTYNITADLIQGLNDQYKVKNKTK